MAESSVTAERVREILDYDPETGIFIRKVRLAQRHKVGDRADFLIDKGNNKGYHRVAFDSERYLAHRVAWLYVYGEWPENMIDHEDHNKANNRIKNLRKADNSWNQQNLISPRKHNSTGFLGVVPHQGRFEAVIAVNNVRHRIGSYDCPEMAHQAYLKAKRKLHPGCTL